MCVVCSNNLSITRTTIFALKIGLKKIQDIYVIIYSSKRNFIFFSKQFVAYSFLHSLVASCLHTTQKVVLKMQFTCNYLIIALFREHYKLAYTYVNLFIN